MQGSPSARDRPRWALLLIGSLFTATPASADKVRITKLSDVGFGQIDALQTDNRRSQSICVYSNGPTSTYSVSAVGSGAGSAFTLANGPHLLAYDLEWSSSPGQTGGSPLSPSLALTAQTSSANNQQCNSGPATTASLTVILRGASLSAAREGNYSGSLTLIISAE